MANPSPDTVRRERVVQLVTAANRRYQEGTDAVDQAASEWFGVNRTDLRCVDILLQRGRVSAGELAIAAGLTPGAVTTVLDRLERANYARRIRDTEDRRRVLVEATQRAVDEAEAVYGPLRDLGRAVMQPFTEHELNRIAQFLDDAAKIQLVRASQLRRPPKRG